MKRSFIKNEVPRCGSFARMVCLGGGLKSVCNNRILQWSLLASIIRLCNVFLLIMFGKYVCTVRWVRLEYKV